jgi:hypothetical protein
VGEDEDMNSVVGRSIVVVGADGRGPQPSKGQGPTSSTATLARIGLLVVAFVVVVGAMGRSC